MRLDFNSELHEYRLDGVRVPSVSQVLAPLEDFEHVPRDVLEAARLFGQHVHEACALLVRDELDWASLDLNLVPYMNGARRFLAESGVTVIASELRVASKRLKIAGTLDLRGYWRKSECIFDFKATADTPRSVGPQVAGYDLLHREHFGGKKCRRYCVQLRADDYRVTPLTDPKDESIFISCLNVWRFKNAIAA
jgi:hypothetical protein